MQVYSTQRHMLLCYGKVIKLIKGQNCAKLLFSFGYDCHLGSQQKIPQAQSNEVIHTGAFQRISPIFLWTSPPQVPVFKKNTHLLLISLFYRTLF